MTYVPLGFTNPHLSDNSEIIGGSAYGGKFYGEEKKRYTYKRIYIKPTCFNIAGTIAGGDGSRVPSVKELEIARFQGESFGNVIKAYVRGKNAFAAEAK
jgi:NAD(P)H dehydrogenase (quinone)